MSSAAVVGDLVWVPDKTCGRGVARVFQIDGPRLGLVREEQTNEFKVLLSIDGHQEELLFFKSDVYDMGDLYG